MNAERLAALLPSEDALRAERLRRSLPAFIEDAWPIIEPATEYRRNWHIDVISEALEAASDGEIRKLLINVPPRHMKSLSVCVFWPAWLWLAHPERRFIYGAYSNVLSYSHSLLCRRLIESRGLATGGLDRSERTLCERIGYQGLLRLIYGSDAWQISRDQNAKRRFDNSATGSRMATSVGGSVTGAGADVLVLDDPHKPEEAQSDRIRESVIDWHDSTWTTRLNDAETGVQVIVMQRLHERDLAGHVLERGSFTHICLPAEYEPSHPFVWPDDPRTKAGETLWEKWGAKWLAEKQTELGSYGYAGQYQQRPAPADGGILKRSWFRYFDPDGALPHFTQLIQSWDMAFAGTDGCNYVVGQVWGCFGSERYLLRQVRARLEFTDTVRAVEELTAWADERFPTHKGHLKLVEDKANGPAILSTLGQTIPGLVAEVPHGDKVARTRAVAPQIEAGNVLLPGAPNADRSDCDRTLTPDWVQGLLDECAAFPRGANDDQVDALSQALRRLQLSGSGTARKPKYKGQRLTAGLKTKRL